MVKVGATERVVCDCGGVHSAGDVACDIAGVRSHEGLDPAHSPVFVPDQDSVDSKARSSSSERVVELDSSVVNADAEVLESMLVGCAGAAVAPALRHKESLLRQKSRATWLRLDDKNMAFSHRVAKFQATRNSIAGLFIDGSWVSDASHLRSYMVREFNSHFAVDPRLGF
ncbi:hypothetical protein V6N13_004976 [Hibiscus sabdariffa]